WSLYLAQADKDDKALVESWDRDANGILVFTGLFAATVATFVTQSYQLLSNSPVDTTVALLSRISEQINGAANGTVVPALSPPPFQTPASAVVVNVLWSASLFLSVSCALLATLMQRWTRRYMLATQHSASPSIRGRIHVLLSIGVKSFRMEAVVEFLILLLHISVTLFFIGLGYFLFTLSPRVALALICPAGLTMLAYIFLGAAPLIILEAPYDTP
ncbi:hypothetical protein K488DRAFT_15525, partial [Vararia minispora EC-137]